MLSSLYQNRAI